MRYSRFLCLLNGMLLSSNVAAVSPYAPIFSPYVDLTINTHWDSQSQDMEPMDLISPAKKLGIKAYHLAFITDSGQCQPAWEPSKIIVWQRDGVKNSSIRYQERV